MSEQPTRRYQRSFNGLIGAMIVTVLFVLAFVGWRSLFRNDVDDRVEPVDWTESVQVAKQAGLDVVRPRELPDGWTATSVDLRAGDEPRWGLGVLTDEGRFVGIRQQDTSVSDLVETYVDEDASEGDEVRVDSAVSDTWQTWTDDGGDHGYAAEVGDDVVLVYGSAPAADIEAYLGLLTTG